MKNSNFDCIVIGAGHAGAEAAHAAATLGAKTALVTLTKDKIARMSCNPAIGGLAKGQIVREIDALGGLMGLAIDATGIQFKMLNRSKGPAVQSPRAQADRHKYSGWMRQRLEQTANLTIVESMATDILTEDNKVRALVCKDGRTYTTQTVVIATGTFLCGQMYIGAERWAGGRIDEPASAELSQNLRRIGLTVERLATCTPPRLDAATVDIDKLETQYGDDPPVPFSFMTEKIERPQIPCWVTYTNEKVHKLLADNLHRAPVSLGHIGGAEPRYCPSIEVKISKYPDKNRHRICLEPEEQEVKTIYCNGLFTSVPKDVQENLLKLMPGTENARIIRYGYGIEYDYCPPAQLTTGLETKRISGLFLAGQINGTSGYEEAAGQGIIAGINAAGKLLNKEPLVLARDQAYIGVMIDDLLTRQIDEPYRMFTSRAEYRLSLRADNADRRLTQIGKSVGLVDENRWTKFRKKLEGIDKLKKYLQNNRTGELTLWDQLRQPHNTIADSLGQNPDVKKMNLSKDQLQAVTIDAKYEGYLTKQQRLVAGFRALENKKIPHDLDYQNVIHLRSEAREKLRSFKPATLGQASRITGVTPADITVIQVHLKKYH